jgi:pimeloyl-ACP methyl ester carboxylesterase
LLIHGGGEDSSMLAGQASVLADAGFEVITYDRRGTGRSGPDQWPGNGAAQHADDAATILSSLRADPAVVVGVSSGGIVGLQLAARHPSKVAHVVAWEPPVIGVLPGGASIAAAIMEPITAYLAHHPGDYVGAQALLLSEIVGFPVSPDDPGFAAARANAEPMIRASPSPRSTPRISTVSGSRSL